MAVIPFPVCEGSISFPLDTFAPMFLLQVPQGFYTFALMLLYLCPNEISLLPLCFDTLGRLNMN